VKPSLGSLDPFRCELQHAADATADQAGPESTGGGEHVGGAQHDQAGQAQPGNEKREWIPADALTEVSNRDFGGDRHRNRGFLEVDSRDGELGPGLPLNSILGCRHATSGCWIGHH
jgi:hypothetical protein